MYILIAAWMFGGSNYPHTAFSAEYNSLEACQAAAKDIRKDTKDSGVYGEPTILRCTFKGYAK